MRCNNKRSFRLMRYMCLIIISLFGLITIIASGGGGGGDDDGGDDNSVTATYTVTYNANGADSGVVPAAASYAQGASVTVSDNTGSLVKGGYGFSGWCTTADHTGTSYEEGDALTIGAVNVTLYAKWMNADDILASLGVNKVSEDELVTATTTQVDETGNPVVATIDRTDWNPLKNEYAVFSPKSEVFQVGIPRGASKTTWWEDSSQSYSPNELTTADSSAWETNTKTAAVADLDGDGLDEIVVFYLGDTNTVYMRVFNEGAYSNEKDITSVVEEPVGDCNMVGFKDGAVGDEDDGTRHYAWYPQVQVASGDLDGDEIDELVLVLKDTVYLLEVGITGDAVSLMSGATAWTFGSEVTSVATGDPDGDGVDEIGICTAQGGFLCYESDFSTNMSQAITSNNGVFLEACFGDFDGDRLDELAVSDIILNNDTDGVNIRLYDSTPGTGVRFEEGATPKNTFSYNLPHLSHLWGKGYTLDSGEGQFYYAPFRVFPLAVDIDGDGKKDLFANNRVYKNPMTGGSDYKSLPGTYGWVKQAAVGDVDGDAKEDIVAIFHKGVDIDEAWLAGHGLYDIRGAITAYGLDREEDDDLIQINGYIGNVNLAGITDDQAAIYHNGFAYSADDNTVALAVGNVDRDSFRVRYNHDHKLEFTEPEVIAVIVAPPFYSDIAGSDEVYNTARKSWATSFGRSTINSGTFETSLGFSSGVTFEFDQSFSFGVEIAKAKLSCSIKKNWDWRWTWTDTVTKTVTNIADSGKDMVVFTSVPVDVYSYEVVDSDESNDDIGKNLTINVPRDFTTYFVTREFYNSHNGGMPDIDDAVLDHTTGDPWSYPTAGEKDNMLPLYDSYQSDESLTAAQGSGSTKLDIEVTSTETYTKSFGGELEISGGAGAGGFNVYKDWGFRAGMAFTTTTGNGTLFGGTVGYLPTSYFSQPEYAYKSGLFVYNYLDERNNLDRYYWIVNYWVEE